MLFGGGRGIRTLGTRKGTTIFETVGLSHSPIPPFEQAKVGKKNDYFRIEFQIVFMKK